VTQDCGVISRVLYRRSTADVGRQLDLEMIRRVLYATVDVVLFIRDRHLVEVFYDPVFARGN